MEKSGSEFYWPKGTDPVSQAQLWVPNHLYRWQCDVLRDCMQQGSRVAVVTPNGAGKTSVLIPVLGLSWMAAFPGGKVVSTAGVERQIAEQLWPVLRQTLRRYPKWTITEDLKIRAPSQRGLPGSEWEAFTTRDPKYAEGFHPQTYWDDAKQPVYAPLLIIIDEAKAFDDPEMMFALVNRCNPDALMMISTPGEDHGPFFDAFNLERNDPWKPHEITWTDCPHLMTGFEYEVRQRAIEKLGENNPKIMSWVFGKFFRAGGRVIFDNMRDIEMAMSGTIPWVKEGRRRAAIDFSGGGDEQVFAVREGNRVYPFKVFHEPNAMRLSNILLRLFREWDLRPDDILADNGGLGKPCIDILVSSGWAGMGRYMGNEVAQQKDVYKFRLTEDYFGVKELLARQSLILPDDAKLKEQMRKRQYLTKDLDTVLQIEPKEKARARGEESPDRLDALVMLCADMPPMENLVKEAGKKWSGKCGNYLECFDTAGAVSDSGGAWATGMLMEE